VKAKVDLVNIKENIKEYLTLKKHRFRKSWRKKLTSTYHRRMMNDLFITTLMVNNLSIK
jgi:hypothetical protein